LTHFVREVFLAFICKNQDSMEKLYNEPLTKMDEMISNKTPGNAFWGTKKDMQAMSPNIIMELLNKIINKGHTNVN
jgi:hypothetical protein